MRWLIAQEAEGLAALALNKLLGCVGLPFVNITACGRNWTSFDIHVIV